MMRRLLFLAPLVGLFFILTGCSTEPSPYLPSDAASLSDRMIWIVFEPVFGQEQLDRVLSLAPDVVLRGWFKWGGVEADGWARFAWAARRLEEAGIVFGAGGTCSAFFPGESGTSDAQFRAWVSINPRGELEPWFGNAASGCYHGDVADDGYLEYIAAWVGRQIDAGARTFFMDQIDGAPSFRTGYDDAGIAAFRDFLLERYGEGEGWTLTDARWTSRFGISLASDTLDGTMASFDYRLYLARKNLLDNPGDFYANGLVLEWGNPYDSFADSYYRRRTRAAWASLSAAIRAEAARRGAEITLSTNGWNTANDYQLEGVWSSWSVVGGRLDLSESYVPRWRRLVEESRALLGRDVPLVVFHDWDATMPFFDEIGEADRILWLRTYAAEIFASGAVFAWPVSNRNADYCAWNEAAFWSELRQLSTWYREHEALYLGAVYRGEDLVDVGGVGRLTATVTDAADGESRRVHLINRSTDESNRLSTRRNLAVSVQCGFRPTRVRVVSPDAETTQELPFEYAGGRVSLTLPALEAYSVLIME